MWLARLVALPLRALERLHAFVCGQVALSFASPAHTDPEMPVRGAAWPCRVGALAAAKLPLPPLADRLGGCQLHGWLSRGLRKLLAVRELQGELAQLCALGAVRANQDGSLTLALSPVGIAQAVDHDGQCKVGTPAHACWGPRCW